MKSSVIGLRAGMTFTSFFSNQFLVELVQMAMTTLLTRRPATLIQNMTAIAYFRLYCKHMIDPMTLRYPLIVLCIKFEMQHALHPTTTGNTASLCTSYSNHRRGRWQQIILNYTFAS